MPRYKLTIEYDGTPFAGWQIQQGQVSVQGELNAAITGFCGERIAVHGAGRTDAGVHATGQVAHIALAGDWPPERIRDAVNAWLRPQPIAVLRVERAADDFHARFSAKRRHYLYRIINRRADLALHRHRAWRIARQLDSAAMHEAAAILIGRHDFSTFRAADCQAKSAEKTLDRLEVIREGEELRVLISARSFLHHQVRSMVGSLTLVGLGKWGAKELAAALAARSRTACGPLAPPEGLYLVQVDY